MIIVEETARKSNVVSLSEKRRQLILRNNIQTKSVAERLAILERDVDKLIATTVDLDRDRYKLWNYIRKIVAFLRDNKREKK